MPARSRRTLLKRIGAALGTASLLGVAGCNRATDGEADPDTSSRTPRPTPTGTDTPDDTTTATPTDVPPVEGAWESYRHGATNTATTDDPGPVADPAVVWRYATATGGDPATAPVAVAGAFVVVMESGIPYALDAADGTVRWVGSRTVSTDVPPVTAADTVILPDGETLVGLDAGTGAERWTVSLERPVEGIAAGAAGVVATTSDAVVGVSPADGTVGWRHRVDGTVATGPAAGDGVAAVWLAGGDLLAVGTGGATPGEVAWRTPAGTEPAVAPAVGGGRVYAAVGTRLLAFGAVSGERLWRVRTAHPVAAPPVPTARGVAVATLVTHDEVETTEREGTPLPTDANASGYESDVVALAPDGTERWRATASGTRNFTAPAVTVSLSAAPDRILHRVAGEVLAYDAATGRRVWTANAAELQPAVTEGVVSTGPTGLALADGTARWEFSVGERVASSPAVVDNTVYVGSDDYHLYALGANTGALEWRARTNGRVQSSPAVTDDTVYVGSTDGHLYALDRADGTERWTVDVGSPVRSSPTVGGESVYVGSDGGALLAVEATDGRERWRVDYDGAFRSSTAALADGTVYAGTQGSLRALAATDGRERWRVDFGSRLLESVPAVADGRVFVTTVDTVYALDAADGTELWTRRKGGSSDAVLAVDGGTVYVPGAGVVRAFDVADGDERWHAAVGLSRWVVVGDDTVYTQGRSTVTALDAADGTARWRYPGVETAVAPGLADEYLFFGDERGRVRALGPAPE